MIKRFLIGCTLIGAVWLGWHFLQASSENNLKGTFLKVGVTSGPHTAILEFVKKEARAKGLDIRIVAFDDFILPNAALQQGDIDVNVYQHDPFLQTQVQERGYRLKSVGKSVLMPLGLYSQKFKSVEEIPAAARVAIPSDPTNLSRALLLLEKAGLITLDACQAVTRSNILNNPKQLKIIELDAPLLPRALSDVDVAVINTDWIVVSGLKVSEALFMEEAKNSPYTNLIVVKEGQETRPDILQFVSLYQSDSVKAFIEKAYGKAVQPGW